MDMKKQNQLEILVVDNDPGNLASADALRQIGHKVDTASTFVEGMHLLTRGVYKAGRFDKLGIAVQPEKPYDVVLTDCNFTQGELVDNEGNTDYLAEIVTRPSKRQLENSLGYPFALYAAATGVKHIAIVTAGNHHDGSLIATFDLFYDRRNGKSVEIPLQGGKMKLLNGVGYIYRLKDGTWTTESDMWFLYSSDKEISHLQRDQYEFEDRGLKSYRRKPETFAHTTDGHVISGKNWVEALRILVS